MSCKERARILMAIAVETAGTVFDTMEPTEKGWTLRHTFLRPSAQFVNSTLADMLGMPMKPGDIVRCCTNPNHDWAISELIEIYSSTHFLLREIAGGRTCDMSNESLDVLRFMPKEKLYYGNQRKIYQWASVDAFKSRYNPDADDFKKCGGVEFIGDELIIYSRPHVWLTQKKDENGNILHAQPRKFTMKWDDKIRLKDIVSAMREQGFAEDFAWHPATAPDGGNPST